ncbi:hypothetical protein FO519_009315, partial [Halicephalobus sp. NKZ332]
MIDICLLLVILVGVHGISVEYGQPKVVTKYGDVYGIIRKINIERERGCLECPEKSVFFFKGVPFAKPPVGPLSVSWLTYSHHSKGLFKQALPYCGVSHSGMSAFNSTLTESKRLEDEIGCGTAKNKKECLKTKSEDEVWKVAHYQYLQKENTILYSWMSPVFDNDLFPGSNWTEAEKTAPVIPILYGMNTNEDATFVIDESNPLRRAKYCPMKQEEGLSFGKENLIEALTYLLSSGNFYGNRSQEAVQKVIDYYLTRGDNNPSHKFLQAYTEFFSNLHFNVGAVREVKQKAQLGNRVYFYLNDYNIPDYPLDNPIIVGSSHCGENSFIYGNWSGMEPPSNHEKYNEYKKVQKEFVDMWVSFIKYSIPVHSGQFLPRVTPHQVPYAFIRNATVMKENLWREASAFWETIAKEYGFDFLFPASIKVSSARFQCLSDNGTLPSIHSGLQNNALTDFISNFGIQVWLGITCWSSGCSWDDGSLYDYQNFANGGPDTTLGNCAFLALNPGANGYWDSTDCNFDLRATLCQKDAIDVPTCKDPFSMGPDGRCYYLPPLITNPFDSAESYCANYGAHLVSIENGAQNSIVKQLGTSTDVTEVFIGLSYNGTYYSWTDPQAVYNYTNWAAGYPNNNIGSCVMMDIGGLYDGQWRSFNCMDYYPFACSYGNGNPPPVTTSPSPLPSSSSTSRTVTPTYSCPSNPYYQYSGYIYSPGYPNYYGGSTECQYYLFVDTNNYVAVKFSDFDLKSGDYLDLFDGENNLIVRLQGTINLSQ